MDPDTKLLLQERDSLQERTEVRVKRYLNVVSRIMAVKVKQQMVLKAALPLLPPNISEAYLVLYEGEKDGFDDLVEVMTLISQDWVELSHLTDNLLNLAEEKNV